MNDIEGPNVIHDLNNSEMGQWEGSDILLDESDVVKKTRVEKSDGYDLWTDLSLFNGDMTFK